MKAKRGLKYKLSAMAGTVFLMWLAFGVYMNYTWYETTISGEAGKVARLTAQSMAAGIARDMSVTDYSALQGVVDAVMKSSDVKYVRIADAAGNIVNEAKPREGIEGLVVMDADVVSGGAKVGSVSLGVSSKEAAAVMPRFVVWQVVAVAFLVFASALMLLYAFKRLVLSPVSRMNSILTEMARGGGDLTESLEVHSTDEIGELAGNFNRFLGSLRGLVARAQDSSSRVLGLTDRLGEKSGGIMTGARDQAQAADANFQALERMDHSVRDVAGSAERLSVTAGNSSATVTEMAAQVDVVAEASGELSRHVEEATSSISQMTGSIREVADNVGALAELASRAAEGVVRIEESIQKVEEKAKESAKLSQMVAEDAGTLGNKAMAKTIEGMERISETVSEAAEVIERLGRRSDEIGRILGVIDEVTKQTSLLALNAAILAAQSGEHGKGFSVVADEIKGLAERTNASTGEIAKLISSVQDDSRAAVDSIRLGRERVTQGVELAYGAARALSDMLESSNRSSATATAIEKDTTLQVGAVLEVSEAVKNVHQRVRSIERATIEQSKGSELIAQAAESMNDIARELRKAMVEQARGIREFAKSLEEAKEVVGTIAEATKSQTDESSGLVGYMEKFRDIAKDNSTISGEIEAAVAELMRQAEALRQDLGRFKV